MYKNARIAVRIFLVFALLATSSIAIAMEKFTDAFAETVICENGNGVSEEIYISGIARTRVQYVENADHSTWVWQVFFHGDGLGLASGAEYILRGKWMEVIQENPPYIFIWNDHFQLTGKGKAENYDTFFKVKFVVNANGDPIIEYVDFYQCEEI